MVHVPTFFVGIAGETVVPGTVPCYRSYQQMALKLSEDFVRQDRSLRVTAHQPQVVVLVRLNRPINPLIQCFLSEISEFRPSSPGDSVSLNIQRSQSIRFVPFFSRFSNHSDSSGSRSIFIRTSASLFPIIEHPSLTSSYLVYN